MRSLARLGVVLIAVGSAGLVAAAAAVVVVELTGGDVGVFPLLVAGVVLTVGVLMAAATSAHAILRRRWGWAVLLVLAWPVAIPLYLRSVFRSNPYGGGSLEAQV